MLVNTPLWPRWIEIAADAHAQACWAQARAQEGDNTLADELRASMVAISACAHAIDALHGATSELIHVPASTRAAWERNDTARWARILQTLQLGAYFKGNPQQLHRDMEWLFDLRDAAVHYREEPALPAPHPSGVNVGPAGRDFNVEAAERAFGVLQKVFQTCLDAPRPNLVEWAHQHSGGARDLLMLD